MNIDRAEFIAWMQRIIERLNIIDDYIKKENLLSTPFEGEELLDNQDLLFMLKISNRSLQRYRSQGKLPYYTISGKVYYKSSDVQAFIRNGFSYPVSRSRPDTDGQNPPTEDRND